MRDTGTVLMGTALAGAYLIGVFARRFTSRPGHVLLRVGVATLVAAGMFGVFLTVTVAGSEAIRRWCPPSEVTWLPPVRVNPTVPLPQISSLQ